MVVALFDGRTHVLDATPHPTQVTMDPAPSVKYEEEEEMSYLSTPASPFIERNEEDVERPVILKEEIDLREEGATAMESSSASVPEEDVSGSLMPYAVTVDFPTTSASPLVERDEEEEEISSVSSVSSEEDVDLDDEGIIATESTSANVPEEDEQIRPGYQLATAKKSAVVEAQSSGEEAVAERSDGDEDDSSIGSNEEEINEEETSKHRILTKEALSWSLCANVPEEEEQVRPGYLTRGQLAAAKKFALKEDQSSRIEVVEDHDEDEDRSVGSEDLDIGPDEEEITSEEDEDEISDFEASMPQSSASTGAYPERLSTWKVRLDSDLLSYLLASVRCVWKSHPRALAISSLPRLLPRRTKALLSCDSVCCEDKPHWLKQALADGASNKEELPFGQESGPTPKAAGQAQPSGSRMRGEVLPSQQPPFHRGNLHKEGSRAVLQEVWEVLSCSAAQKGPRWCPPQHQDAVSLPRMQLCCLLTEEERERFEASRKTFYEEVDAVMEDYFPELLRKEEMRPACKKCRKRICLPRGRRDHVGAHLKATFPCPLPNCRYSGQLGSMLVHLHCKHGKNLQMLTKDQRGRFEESRRAFVDQVEAAMGEFFL
uniref:C2H2-type domain-containing protein n=1 Tax=Steinernema glaseri TaxID=37863 RepID=A0A1I7Y0W9_9BILA